MTALRSCVPVAHGLTGRVFADASSILRLTLCLAQWGELRGRLRHLAVVLHQTSSTPSSSSHTVKTALLWFVARSVKSYKQASESYRL
jgi:hypothetical protein